MDENQDVGPEGFEERIRGLFNDGVASRGVSAASVIRGARRRRVRHRATMTGSSLAVLGVAAGAVVFGAHGAGPSRTSGVATTPAVATTAIPSTTGAPAIAAPTTTASPSTSTPAPATCSAAVTGIVPATTHTTADGLDFETVSGSTAGIPWSVQIHAFPDWQSWLDWRKTQPDELPPPSDLRPRVETPPALLRPSGKPQMTVTLIPGLPFGFVGDRIGVGASGSPKTYLVQGRTKPTIDHVCLQFAHHAEFEPVYRIQGDAFVVFGYTTTDEPQEAIGYDVAGHVAGTIEGKAGLLMPGGL